MFEDIDPVLRIEMLGDGFTGTLAPETVDAQKLFEDLAREVALEELGIDPEDADAGNDNFARAHTVEGVGAMAKATNPWNFAKIADSALSKARTEANRPAPSAPTLREEIRASVAVSEIRGLPSIKSYLGRVSKGMYENTGGVLDQLRHLYAKLVKVRVLTADETLQVDKAFACADVTLIGAVLNRALERAL